MLIVISGPSGCGKTTICNKLLKEMPGLKRSVSYTTRPPRPGEEDGKDYFFISRDEFEKRIKENRFLEYASVFGNYYGTDKDWVMNEKGDVILSIDVQGAKQIKKNFPDGIFIFLMPPSDIVLKTRLVGRGTDTSFEIKKRLEIAKEEMKEAVNYEYIVINESLDKVVLDIRAIIENHER